MTTAQVVETSVTANNSPIKGYVHPNDHAQPHIYKFPVNISAHPSRIVARDQSFCKGSACPNKNRKGFTMDN